MVSNAPRHLLAILTLSVVTGCGFHPLYAPSGAGTDSAAAAALAQISVKLIPERNGQLLRLALQERFERSGIVSAHQYDLDVSFGVRGEGIAVIQDSTSTFVRFVGTAHYTLTSQDPSRSTITSGDVRAVDGHNAYVNQFFASNLEDEEVVRRLTRDLADQIALQLASFFAQRSTATAG
jgi:LPS-assembly lipoprotein